MHEWYSDQHSECMKVGLWGMGWDSLIWTGAEELAIRLMKSVQADGVSIPSEVPTYVRIQGASHGDFVYKFAADENVRFTVKQVLDWLELDLDLPVNKQPSNKWTPEEANAKMALQGPKNFGVNDNFPMLRITGGTPCQHAGLSPGLVMETVVALCWRSRSFVLVTKCACKRLVPGPPWILMCA